MFSDGNHAELLLAFGEYILHNSQTIERFDAIYEHTSYKQRLDEWISQWTDDSSTCGVGSEYSECVIVYALTRSVFGSALLAVLESEPIAGTAYDFVNVLAVIASAHHSDVDFACILFSKLGDTCTEERVFEIVNEAVDIEKLMVKGRQSLFFFFFFSLSW